MALTARYDHNEDRMLLHVQSDPDLSRRYWITRRQWLWLLFRLQTIAKRQGEKLTSLRAMEPPDNAHASLVQEEGLVPVLLETIRVRALERGFRIAFFAGDRAANVALTIINVHKAEEFVFLQAERAGWDPQAGVQRLEAGELASTAIRRVSRLSEEE